MTEDKSRAGLTDANHAMGDVLQALGEAVLASPDITIVHLPVLPCACKRGAEACRRAIKAREEELRANKEETGNESEVFVRARERV